MNGPCLCGDPYCPSCGNPEAINIEEAEQALMNALIKERLTANEYAIVLSVGMAAVKAARNAVDAAEAEAENRAMGESY